MSEPIIEVRNLSKRYQLGTLGASTLREEAESIWNRWFGKDGRSGLQEKETKANFPPTVGTDFWALRDVSFDVQQGEVVGIIGRNGAGKSTLLKILSRITEPTEGEGIIRGRVASLLEVGTGFHPELSGRENIFLNGAILGMKKAEIDRKFDEIVDFAEVDQFIDTPVKRYSSGMYVRLAFAVAAHLEPEILIVDEVLAVGDAQFQKKCLGKMQDVSAREGRTVLFVSHNMGMMTSLCSRGLLLEAGRIVTDGSASAAVMSYYTSGHASPSYINFASADTPIGDDYAQLLECYVKNAAGEVASEIDIRETVVIGFRYRLLQEKHFTSAFTYPQLNLYSATGELVFQSMAPASQLQNFPPGEYTAECSIPGNFLNSDIYFVGLGLASCERAVKVHFYEKSILCFHMTECIAESLYTTRNGFSGAFAGVIRPELQWQIRNNEGSDVRSVAF